MPTPDRYPNPQSLTGPIGAAMNWANTPDHTALPPISTATVLFLLGAVRALVTGIVALVAVIFAGIIALLALPMDKERRDYAIQVADRSRKFVAVLVGARPAHNDMAAGHDERQ
ncbi:MAG: hypothetical protein ACRDRI_02280 [Pseudonocardiaceae bacterium]